MSIRNLLMSFVFLFVALISTESKAQFFERYASLHPAEALIKLFKTAKNCDRARFDALVWRRGWRYGTDDVYEMVNQIEDYAFKNDGGNTPLMYAANSCCFYIVRRLVKEFGADVYAKNKKERTALEYAQAQSNAISQSKDDDMLLPALKHKKNNCDNVIRILSGTPTTEIKKTGTGTKKTGTGTKKTGTGTKKKKTPNVRIG